MALLLLMEDALVDVLVRNFVMRRTKVECLGGLTGYWRRLSPRAGTRHRGLRHPYAEVGILP